MKKWLKRGKRRLLSVKSIPPVEKILLLLMLLLFAQFFIVLMGGETQGTESIDVVQRSVAAMIFGYFVGGSVSEKADKAENVDAVSGLRLKGEADGGVPVAKIGFASEPSGSGKNEDSVAGPASKARYDPAAGNDLQVWIVGAIGFLSLVFLFMARNVEACRAALKTDSGIATLSQLRDFAAGSIGYLVSTTKSR